MSAGLPARAAAQLILSDVLRKRRPLDHAADVILPKANLDPRDEGFARAIVSETLRHFGELDALIRSYVPKPPQPHRSGSVPEILLAGACELLILNVSAHAAVDAANRLATADHKALHFKPLINAVLRRVSREGQDDLGKLDRTRLNVPDWLWQRWVEAYGEEVARAISQAQMFHPPTDIQMKPGCVANFELQQIISDQFVRLQEPGRIDLLPGYTEGNWWVQDFAASLPVQLLGDVRNQTVLDLCAAPGGKTLQLAAAGAHVIAVDRDADRISRITKNLDRVGLPATLVQADVLDFKPEAQRKFVLLDAPCSATGTIRRHPELPWIKSAGDVVSCAQTAAELLDAAAEMVAPGGTLVFAVCSLEPEEGPEQIADFLLRHAEFTRQPISTRELSDIPEAITPDGDLRTFPHFFASSGGMDGFYAARLKRVS